MSWVAAAIAGAAVVGGVVSSNSSSKAASAAGNAANTAASAQTQAAQLGIDEQKREFDLATGVQNSRYADVQALLKPYTDAGQGGVQGMQQLLGLAGGPNQAYAIDQIQNGPQFQALAQQGENGILQNASATGGLRGGNTQAALAQFRPQLLSSLIDQQYQRLGGLASLGQNSAAGVGNAGVNTGNGIAQGALSTGQGIAGLLGQQGAAQAGGALAAGRAGAAGAQAGINGIGTGLGIFQGLGGNFSNLFGGSNNSTGNILANNQGFLNANPGVTPADLLGSF